MSGALVPRTEKQPGAQKEQILRINIGSTYSPTKQRGVIAQPRRRGPGIHTSVGKFHLAIYCLVKDRVLRCLGGLPR